MSMTVKEAGAKGGRATQAKYGRAHYQKMSALGLKMLREEYGDEYFTDLAFQGGEALRQKHANDNYFSEIGKKGGAAMKAKYSREYYQKIGKLAAEKRWGKKKDTQEGEPL